MIDEKEFKKNLDNMSHDALVSFAYSLAVKNSALEENYQALRRRVFGIKHNEHNPHVSPDQLSLFNEAEAIDDTASVDQKKEPSGDDIIVKPSKKHRHGKNAKLKNVRIIDEPDIELEDRNCPKCSKPMGELAPTVFEWLEHIPEEYVLHRVRIHNYTCHSCNNQNMNCVTYHGNTDCLPVKPIQSSLASASVISHIAYEKYLVAVPIYRLSKDLRTRGIEISRQVMCSWLMKCAELYLDPIVRRMTEDLRKCKVLNMDETSLEVLEDIRNGSREKSYTWLAMSGKHETKQMALYFYNVSRAYSFIYEILGHDFHGVIQSDGYQAYDKYEAASAHAGCSAHCRRKFEEAAKAYTDLYAKYSSLKDKEEIKQLLDNNPSFGIIIRFLDEYSKLYGIEKQLNETKASPETILRIRQEKEKPIWEELRNQLDYMDEKLMTSGKLGKAITYAKNQWDKLMYYLSDWQVGLDNNLAEREGIKPFVLARKNFLFADTKHGAKYSCMYFSILISARMNSLNPEKYLAWLIDQMAGASVNGGIQEEDIQRCLPYAPDLPQDLQISKNCSES